MDTEWLIYHLIHNDDDRFTSIDNLDIDLSRSDLDQWDRLLLGFSRNRTVTSIELSRGFQRPVVTEDDLQNLFSALRRLPNLSKVKLNGFTTFDLQQTESLFVDNDTIEEIWVENARFLIEDEDEEENMDEYDFEDDRFGYEVFLEYLASMSTRNLRRLRIEVPEKLSQNANMTALLHESSKLESLIIEKTDVQSPTVPHQSLHFGTAMAALQSNSVLKTLDMDFRISFTDFKHVARMLKHNRTLAHLNLRPDHKLRPIRDVEDDARNFPDFDFDPHLMESTELFFEALKTNTNSALKSYKQYYSLPELNLLRLSHRSFAKRIERIFCLLLDMLHFNMSLESFVYNPFEEINYEATGKKSMLLNLNKRGRRSILHRDISESVPKSRWVEQLSKHSMDDVDGLYYYISANPLICKMSNAGKTRSTTCRQTNTIDALGERDTTSDSQSSRSNGSSSDRNRRFAEGPKTKRQRADKNNKTII